MSEVSGRLRAAAVAFFEASGWPLPEGTDLFVLPQFAALVGTMADERMRGGDLDFIDDALTALLDEVPDDRTSAFLAAKRTVSDDRLPDDTLMGLVAVRSCTTGIPVALHDLEVDLVATPSGGVVPRSRRTNESFVGTLQGVLQVLVKETDAHDDTPHDSNGLWGEVAARYNSRQLRRSLWGAGTLLVTSERLVGLMFTDEVPDVPGSHERARTPQAQIWEDATSVVVFELDRRAIGLVDEAPPKGLLGKRMGPTAIVASDGHWAAVVETYRMLDASGRERRPRKGDVAELLTPLAKHS